MSEIDTSTRQLVRERARDRCEYCHLPQAMAPFVRFQIEHIYARQHGPDHSLGNLALACPDCNRHKGPNLTTLDEATGDIVRLFHPRTDVWEEHFRYDGALIVGISIQGMATARLLQMNASERVELRAEILTEIKQF